MAPKPKHWHDLRAPENAQQKLAYINACQTWFAEVNEYNSTLGGVSGVVSASQSAGALASHTFGAHAQVHLGSASVARCFDCGAEAAASEVGFHCLNPFSQLFALKCAECMAASNCRT